jgi:peptide/nickel transport system substrate-binding protein
VLRIIGSSDVDHLSTTSAYATQSNHILHTFTRQLVSYEPDTNFAAMTRVAADLLSQLPTRENGGISADGKTYTMHLRRGVKWNTTPAREVTAADAVRGIKMMCNPVSPFGAPGYYEHPIAGLSAYCAEFAKVKAIPADIRQFVTSHEIAGVRSPDDTTIVFTLLLPTADFLDILTLNFPSPMPVEYLDYLPDGADFRTHTISDGPYQITHYVPNREIILSRNPAWSAATDPLRKGYVDSIIVTMGIDAEAVQQQLQAGTSDLSFDQTPPTADLAQLIASKDPNLVLGPLGDHYAGMAYMTPNLLGPTENGALRKLKVRQAIEYAVDRTAAGQVLGGPLVAQPSHQAVVSGAAGSLPGFDLYPTSGDHGDPAKAKQLLAEAGYPNGITLKLLFPTGGFYPLLAQTVQANLARAGIQITMVPATFADFLAKYLQNPENAKRGVWDLAVSVWFPDWFGANNGRSVIEALYDGRTYGPNSMDSGDYNSDQTNAAIDNAEGSLTNDQAATAWRDAGKQILADAAVIPLVDFKYAVYHSSRLHNCVFSLQSFNCDISSLWLSR